MIIGIDPGKKGGVAMVSRAGEIVDSFVMPDGYDLASRLARLGKSRCYLERVGAMPGQGVTSMFTFGSGYGMIQGILIALGIPYELVTPFTWQRTMHRGINRNGYAKPKERSLRAMRQIYPDFNPRPGKCRLPHDGIVDAVMIATYGYRQESNRKLVEDKINDNGGNAREGTPETRADL